MIQKTLEKQERIFYSYSGIYLLNLLKKLGNKEGLELMKFTIN